MRWLWWNYIVVDHANDLVVVTRWMEDSKMGEFMNGNNQFQTKLLKINNLLLK
jgi:hypothetical protein